MSSIGDVLAVVPGHTLEMFRRLYYPGWHRGCGRVWRRAPATEQGRHQEKHMKRTLTFTSAVIVAALSVAALPAAAQAHRNSGHQGGGGHVSASQSAPRQASHGTSAQPRQSAPHGSYSAGQAVPRAYGNRSYSAPQAMSRSYGNSSYGARTVGPRSNSPSYRGGGYGYASPGYRGYAGRSSMIRPYFSRSYIRPYGWAPYYPFRFARPYYAFSPWLSLGFGFWCGYPVRYPWAYMGDYQPTVFGDYPDGDYQAVPGSSTSTYGGASFDIQPTDADLFVDGEYVGPVGNFTPNSEPLTLTPGNHRIAVQREGFRPMEWDATIEPGQVIPYRGVLERQ